MITSDAVRKRHSKTKSLIRNILPPSFASTDQWALFFCVKTDYNSIDGKSVYLPIFLNNVQITPGSASDYDKIFYKDQYSQWEINVGVVDRTLKEVVLEKSFFDPPFTFIEAFIDFETFLAKLKQNGVFIFLPE